MSRTFDLVFFSLVVRSLADRNAFAVSFLRAGKK